MAMPTPLHFITFGQNVENPFAFELTSEAKLYLSTLSGPLRIISIAGLYRTGKSYLLSQFIKHETSTCKAPSTCSFAVGTSIQACTQGIWCYGSTSSDNSTLLFLDTEGLGSTKKSATQDRHLFSLSLLLCSTFMYNSRGLIDKNAIMEMANVVALTKNMEKEDACEGKSVLVWIVRDFTLQLKREGGNEMTEDEYLEKALEESEGQEEQNAISRSLKTFFPTRYCRTLIRPVQDEEQLKDLNNLSADALRPQFVVQMESLKKLVLKTVQEKKIKNKTLDGTLFIALTESYLEAFNTGKAPVISNTWDRMVSSYYEKAYEKAVCECDRLAAAMLNQNLINSSDSSSGSLPGSSNQNLINPGFSNQNLMTCGAPMEEEAVLKIYQAAFDGALNVLCDREGTMGTVASSMIYRQALFEHMETTLSQTLVQNEKMSKTFCENEILKKCEAFPILEHIKNDDELEKTTNDLETYLNSFEKVLKRNVEMYLVVAKGPVKDTVLSTYLSNALNDLILQWGSGLKQAYTVHISGKQRRTEKTKQRLSILEGRSTALQSILSKQKKAYSTTLSSLQQRSKTQRIDFTTQSENYSQSISRANQNLDTQRQHHCTERDRLALELQDATTALEKGQDVTISERKKRDEDLSSASRELIEVERTFHTEEKALITLSHDTMLSIVKLEREVGDCKANQLKTCFSIEQKSSLALQELRVSLKLSSENIKKSIKMELKALQNDHAIELSILRDQLNERKAYGTALEEKMVVHARRSQRARKSAQGEHLHVEGALKEGGKKKKKQDCRVQ